MRRFWIQPATDPMPGAHRGRLLGPYVDLITAEIDAGRTIEAEATSVVFLVMETDRMTDIGFWYGYHRLTRLPEVFLFNTET